MAPANEHEPNSLHPRTSYHYPFYPRLLPRRRGSDLPRTTHPLISPKRCKEGLPSSDPIGPSRQTSWYYDSFPRDPPMLSLILIGSGVDMSLEQRLLVQEVFIHISEKYDLYRKAHGL
jgi:hypothetical protein